MAGRPLFPRLPGELGTLWVLAAFGALAAAALAAPPSASPSTVLATPAPATRAPTGTVLRLARCLAPAAAVLAIGCSTYVGARTYPSFAMFSNLRVEGGRSNHWVAPLRASSRGPFAPCCHSRGGLMGLQPIDPGARGKVATRCADASPHVARAHSLCGTQARGVLLSACRRRTARSTR